MEELIQLVRENPVLYDTSHESYMKVKMKDAIWDKIAEQLNFASGNEAKEQWRKVRDCHRDALRRQGRKRAKGLGTRPWVYQRQMEFLVPYMTSRNQNSLVEGSDGLPPEDVEDDDKDDDHITLHQDSSGLFDFELPNEEEEDGEAPGHKVPKISYAGEVVVSGRKTAVNCQTDPHDQALYQFFMSMYHSTVRLPAAHQLAVRRQLFDAVTRAEEEVMLKELT